MKSGPHLASIATLIGDRARADMLSALMSGKALTATELADVAGITKQTASTHLSKLMQRRLLTQEQQGRHRYFRLSGADVAQLLEQLMSVAQRVGATRLQTGPSEPALRYARVCYDHLAGEVGVQLFDSLTRRGLLRVVGEGAELTTEGERFMNKIDIDVKALRLSRRVMCRVCLDWSVRRHHLAGSLGAALLNSFTEKAWTKRLPRSRIVKVTPQGLRALQRTFAMKL